MSSLRSVVYVSAAHRPLTVAELESLLKSAREANLRNGITGVLLYDDGNFMQCLEGPEAAVEETYARIRASRQHHGIFELMNERVAQRSFEDWDMGLARANRSELLALSTANWRARTGESAGATAPTSGLGLLLGFWQRARRER
jgi:hypothetical protein